MGTIIKFIWNAIQIVIISILSIFYYPLNTAFMALQKHYRIWQKEDRTSFYIATPLYYLLFIVTALLSFPLEHLGEGFHPSLPGFR
jgi:drug/metabolite transporter (DMT)-like permease